ncbi:hypothetical protein, partial [Klebsiella variicola]|uniref:hypothetical protein n=1 Tax=Klebsiella variicola TaxID=244366 RepID=UPI0019535602
PDARSQAGLQVGRLNEDRRRSRWTGRCLVSDKRHTSRLASRKNKARDAGLVHWRRQIMRAPMNADTKTDLAAHTPMLAQYGS